MTFDISGYMFLSEACLTRPSLSMFFNCGSDNDSKITEDATEIPNTVNTTSIDWDNLPDGSYTETQATKDLGNIHLN